MRYTLIAVTAAILTVPILTPAIAIDADLAKKCRAMAIKANPTQLPGSKAYAQAQRDFYAVCISKNGDMTDKDVRKPPSSGQE
jgi:hypothetical protein